MRQVTVRFPGMLPVIQRVAETHLLTEEQVWQARERAAEERLTQARRDLDSVQSAMDGGHLPVTGGTR